MHAIALDESKHGALVEAALGDKAVLLQASGAIH
jgi:hypothetical protein